MLSGEGSAVGVKIPPSPNGAAEKIPEGEQRHYTVLTATTGSKTGSAYYGASASGIAAASSITTGAFFAYILLIMG